MPRIRTIKPELWESPDVHPMDDAFQALFCWLISNADDAGRLHMDAAHIAQRRRRTPRLIERRLLLMEERGMIVRYQVAERPYIALTGWRDHQRVDHPAHTVYPGPPNSNNGVLARTREDSRDFARTTASRAPGPDPTRPDPTRPDTNSPPAPLRGEDAEHRRRASGTNPRASATNPRARRRNPRAVDEQATTERHEQYVRQHPNAGEFRPD